MSALRLPQHLAEPAHVDSGEAHLRFDLLEDLDAAVGHAERQVERTLRALRAHDAAGIDPSARGPLLEAAVEAVWRLFVQHEACDCADHHELIERYRIPPEVLARIGGVHPVK
ncbi:MAG TPA: DUF6665 family protein [Phenylobacterium sp.]|nr:DUF6665 family protein [Phenylobacterium sp.]